MFCDEPIQKVFSLELKEGLRPKWCNSFLQIMNRFEYHTTYGLWCLFETESFYITVGYGGVVKYPKPYKFSEEKYSIDILGDEESPSYEGVIFTGQHIRSVENQGKETLVHFDDFSWKVFVYGEKEDKWFEFRSYGTGDEIVPVGVHLLKKCPCGGKPEIYLDHVEDFFIRCGACHASTYANMYFKECMDDWNKGNTPITLSTTGEELQKALSTQKIKRIVVSDKCPGRMQEDSCLADGVIIEFDSVKILLGTTKLGEEASRFACHSLTWYNEQVYSYVIYPSFGELKYLGCCKVGGHEEMSFLLDDVKLIITTDGRWLHVSLAKLSEDVCGEVKRNQLFC